MSKHKLAYQGLAGAYSHLACKQFFGDEHQATGYNSFQDIITAVETDEADYAILPIENSTAGDVTTAIKILFTTELKIKAETIVNVEHNLLVQENTAIEKIKTAISHPQALAQCSDFLNKHKIKPQEFYDTAGAAKYLSNSNNNDTAAIASNLAAKLYKLDIAAKNIANTKNNRTRFFILGKKGISNINDHNKATISFTISNQSVAMLKILEILAVNKINITKFYYNINPNKLWHYEFALDITKQNLQYILPKTLDSLNLNCNNLKVIGTYQAN